MQHESIDTLSILIDELTESLRTTHLREGVLKARLNEAIEKKYRLLRKQSHDRRRQPAGVAPRPQAPPSPIHQQERQPPVQAVVVEEESKQNSDDSTTLEAHFDNNSSSPRYKRPSNRLDRDGSIIRVGDEVKFLTSGRNTTETGIVERFSRRYVHCIDRNNTRTKRAPRNVRVIEEIYHECNN